MEDVFAWIVGIIAMVLPGFGEPATPSWNG